MSPLPRSSISNDAIILCVPALSAGEPRLRPSEEMLPEWASKCPPRLLWVRAAKEKAVGREEAEPVERLWVGLRLTGHDTETGRERLLPVVVSRRDLDGMDEVDEEANGETGAGAGMPRTSQSSERPWLTWVVLIEYEWDASGRSGVGRAATPTVELEGQPDCWGAGRHRVNALGQGATRHYRTPSRRRLHLPSLLLIIVLMIILTFRVTHVILISVDFP
ncbi:hypothetical protein FPV67DRAFT_1449056 [Lyophyllum atratum]|nr:hypothetical protein FPV67DRAFT_1449056 [Lyophyllum atratum]